MAALKALFVAACASVTTAWWSQGHMLVAQIALDSGLMDATVIQDAEKIISEVNSYWPTSPDFVTSAVWADDLKSEGNYLEANWHFIDIPVVDNSNPPPAPPPQPPTENVAWAITEGSSTVRSTKSTALDKSRQLRFMNHFIGDIHQPLHAASYFSEQFPSGDAGGNAWPIAGSFATELHAFMDAGAGLWQETYPRPLSPTDAAAIKAQAAALMAALPPTDPSIAGLISQWPPLAWANESVALAESVVYKAPQAPTPLPADYVTATESLCRRQVTLAGYRLAYQLSYTLGAADSEARLAQWAEDARLSANRRAEATGLVDAARRSHASLRKRGAAAST